MLNGRVEVADGAQSKDILPTVVLLEYLEEFVLTYQVAQLRRVFLRGNAQQHTVVVLHQFEKMYLRRVDEQRAVVIILISVDVVIFGVELAGAFQQFNLAHVAKVGEHLDGFLRSAFVANDRNLSVDNLLHPARYALHILVGDCTAELQVAVVAVGHGDVDHHLLAGINFRGRLA